MNDAAVAWVKTLVPLVVLFVFCASGLWVYNLEIREGGYSPKTSQQASQAVLVTIQGATTHCSATVPADIHVALNEVLLLDAQHTALCHQSLARLDQLAASVQGATEMIAAASEKSYRATAYNRQGALGVVIMMLVSLVVLAGLYFAYLNVIGLSQAGTVTSVLKLGSLELRSPVVGAIVLVASMGFFYLYLTAVFEMRDSRSHGVLAEEVSQYRASMRIIDGKSPPSSLLDVLKDAPDAKTTGKAMDEESIEDSEDDADGASRGNEGN